MTTFATRPRHPVTGARIRLRAHSKNELLAYVHRIEELRTKLRLGIATEDEVNRELRHLRFGPVTLERAARSYLERPLAPRTKDAVRSLMGTHWAELLSEPLAALTPDVVGRLVDAMRRAGLGETTIGTAWRKLSAIARHAAERGWIGDAPWGSFRPRIGRTPVRPPREAARSLEELARLLLAAGDVDQEQPQRMNLLEAMLGCLALFGLRQGELAGLRWTDWNARDLQLYVARQYRDRPLKRGTQPRFLGTIDELASILDRQRAHLEARKLWNEVGPIFPHPQSRAGWPRHYTSGPVVNSRDLRSVIARAKLPNPEAWSAHSLRDTFVTLEAAATQGDLAAVATRSRHASLTSLARYLRALSRDSAPPAFTRQRSADGAGLPLLGHAQLPPKEPPP